MDGNSYDLARLSAGSALTAVELIMAGRATNAHAMLRRSGHHAWAESGYGFCIFNNCGVAARAAQAAFGVARVAIVDIDAHHGNGTESIFLDDPSVRPSRSTRIGASRWRPDRSRPSAKGQPRERT